MLEDFYGAQEFTGDRLSRIAWVAWQEGRETMRRVLAGEQIQPLSDDLKKYEDSMEQKQQLYGEQMKYEAERRGQAIDQAGEANE